MPFGPPPPGYLAYLAFLPKECPYGPDDCQNSCLLSRARSYQIDSCRMIPALNTGFFLLAALGRYFFAVTVISICLGPTSLAMATVVRVGFGLRHKRDERNSRENRSHHVAPRVVHGGSKCRDSFSF